LYSIQGNTFAIALDHLFCIIDQWRWWCTVWMKRTFLFLIHHTLYLPFFQS